MTIDDGIQKSGLNGRKDFKHEFVSVLKKNPTIKQTIRTLPK